MSKKKGRRKARIFTKYGYLGQLFARAPEMEDSEELWGDCLGAMDDSQEEKEASRMYEDDDLSGCPYDLDSAEEDDEMSWMLSHEDDACETEAEESQEESIDSGEDDDYCHELDEFVKIVTDLLEEHGNRLTLCEQHQTELVTITKEGLAQIRASVGNLRESVAETNLIIKGCGLTVSEPVLDDCLLRLRAISARNEEMLK